MTATNHEYNETTIKASELASGDMIMFDYIIDEVEQSQLIGFGAVEITVAGKSVIFNETDNVVIYK